MFSKEDYEKYFLQIKKVEQNMADHFLLCSERVDDPGLKKFFLGMHKEELAHGRVADAMLEMVSKKPQ